VDENNIDSRKEEESDEEDIRCFICFDSAHDDNDIII
jgi:hypothetical protein